MRNTLLTLWFCACIHLVSAQQNVILIIADDLGPDYCGFTLGATDTAKMPNIRSLLSKGIIFNNAWASPFCSSTRAGIQTGRYSFRTGVGTVIAGASSNDLDTSENSIANILKQHPLSNYATATIGKWHLNQQTAQKKLYPTNVFGYDMYKGNFLGEIPDYYNWTKITNGTQTDTITNYATTETINDAIDWLDTLQSNKPFFLWLAFNAPHSPFHLPPAALHTVPGLTGTTAHINANRTKYFKAMIEAMDTETGRLFQWLISNNKMDSTNIIFIGDNGNDKRVIQIADTTHTKGTIYDYGVHVPFIISGPAVINPNRSEMSLVNTPDIFSTVLELCGFTNWSSAIPSGITVDSKSLLPIIKNTTSTIRDWIFTELFTPIATIKDGKTIRNLEYKLLKFDNGLQEFYHLSSDPIEQQNLLTQTMTTIDVSNYTFLCNQLSSLTGAASCQSAVGIDEMMRETNFSIQCRHQSVYMKSNEDFIFNIYTIDGRRLQSQKLLSGTHHILMPTLIDGLYVLEMLNSHNKAVAKYVALN